MGPNVNDPTALIREFDTPLHDLADGCQALLRIAEGIAVEDDKDAAAVFFVARAMQKEVGALQDLFERMIKLRRGAKEGAASAVAADRGGAAGPGGPKLMLVGAMTGNDAYA